MFLIGLERMKFKLCLGSFVLTGLVEAAAIPYLGLRIEELSLDEKAELLFLDQGYALLFFFLFLQVFFCVRPWQISIVKRNNFR